MRRHMSLIKKNNDYQKYYIYPEKTFLTKKFIIKTYSNYHKYKTNLVH